MWGGGEAYRVHTGCSLYTVEAHINYLREVKEGTPLNVSTQLLNFDDKRMHLFHEMLIGDEDTVVATTDVIALHVDPQPSVTPMPPDILGKLKAIYEDHKNIPVPRNAGVV
jgi:acyl-CoA thioesterase FadM